MTSMTSMTSSSSSTRTRRRLTRRALTGSTLTRTGTAFLLHHQPATSQPPATRLFFMAAAHVIWWLRTGSAASSRTLPWPWPGGVGVSRAGWKVRFHALACVQAIARHCPRVFTAHSKPYLPDSDATRRTSLGTAPYSPVRAQQTGGLNAHTCTVCACAPPAVWPRDTWRVCVCVCVCVLVGVMREDGAHRVRGAAAAALGAALHACRPYLQAAADEPGGTGKSAAPLQRSYTPLSRSLAATVRRVTSHLLFRS
jgi:hypothetical protein